MLIICWCLLVMPLLCGLRCSIIADHFVCGSSGGRLRLDYKLSLPFASTCLPMFLPILPENNIGL